MILIPHPNPKLHRKGNPSLFISPKSLPRSILPLAHVLNQGYPLPLACSLEIDILPSPSYELLVILFAYRERPRSRSSSPNLAFTFPITRGRMGTRSSIEREERRLAEVER